MGRGFGDEGRNVEGSGVILGWLLSLPFDVDDDFLLMITFYDDQDRVPERGLEEMICILKYILTLGY